MQTKKKVLILGSTGMLGHVLTTYLEESQNTFFEVYKTSRRPSSKNLFFDALDKKSFSLFEEKSFDFIINCIGVLVSESKVDLDKAFSINRDLPLFLESRFKDTKTKVIHISTDCVFKGLGEGGYETNDVPDATYNYGVSKSMGELRNDKDLTIRTSIVGPDLDFDGTGLFNWFMLRNEKEIKGFSNAFWNGVSTIELSKFIVYSIQNDLVGLVHHSKEVVISKYDLLHIFKEYSRCDSLIEKDESFSVNKTLKPSKSCASQTDYVEMVKNIFQWIEEHPNMYPHY